MKRLWNNLIFHLKSFEFFCKDCSCTPQPHTVMKWSPTSNWCIKHAQHGCFYTSVYMLHLTFHFNHFSHPDIVKVTITVGQNRLWWQNWKGSNLCRNADTVSTGTLQPDHSWFLTNNERANPNHPVKIQTQNCHSFPRAPTDVESSALNKV